MKSFMELFSELQAKIDIYGKFHYEVIKKYIEIGDFYFVKDDFNLCLSSLNEAIVLVSKMEIYDHDLHIDIMEKLGHTYNKIGSIDQSITYFHQAYLASQKYLGEESAKTNSLLTELQKAREMVSSGAEGVLSKSAAGERLSADVVEGVNIARIGSILFRT